MSKQKTIVLCDDEVELCNIVSRRLTWEGYEVHIAHNGVDGLECIRRVSPNVILTDYQMPEMTGLELIKALHDDVALKEIPVIAFSSHWHWVSSEIRRYPNVIDMLPKPFEFKQLAAMLLPILAKNESRISLGSP